MKLATYKNETRDGCLMVVSKDLSRACSAQDIAKTMQQALDNWKEIAPQLQMKLIFPLESIPGIYGTTNFHSHHWICINLRCSFDKSSVL